MNKILVIDPGKGWGNFVSKMYCFQELAKFKKSKIYFLTKSSTQAKYYLNGKDFCGGVIYINEPKKGLINIFYNIIQFIRNISNVNKLNCECCFVFHPSLRYLFIAKFSYIKEVWGIGFKFQNFFLKKNKRLYNNYFSKSFKDDEALQFVKKITNIKNVNFKPLTSVEKDLRDTIGIIIAASGFEKRWDIENYLKIIEFLKKKGFKNFLIISGNDQSIDEDIIKNKFRDELNFIFTSNKKISEVIPYLKYCKFCVGNDTGFSHLSINYDIETIIIYGDCPPQNYSNLIYHVDIDKSVVRSANSIHTIKVDKVLKEISRLLNRRDGRVVEGARLESV